MMPIPKPKEGESQNDFMSRCMSAMSSEFSDEKQRSAVCYSTFRKKEVGSFSVFSPVTKCWTETVKSGESEKSQRFFEVTVSGMKEDRDGEVMDKEAIDDMVLQFKSGKIGLFPDHGRDPISGERTYSWKQLMGVWVDASVDGDRLKAIARLNNAHPDADMLWNFIQEGMPVGFSIGGRPAKVIEEELE